MHWQYTHVQSIQPLTNYYGVHCTALYSREYTTAFQLRRRRSRHCTALDCTGYYYYGCTSCTMFFLRGELSFYSSCTEQHCTAHSHSSTLALSASTLCTTETCTTLLLSFKPSSMLWLSLHAVTSSIMLNICKKIPQKIAKTHFCQKL